MKLDISLFKDLFIKFIVGEIIIFAILIFIAGYFINKDDPLFMESQIRFLFHLLPMIVITLFYGLIAGLGYYIMFTAASMYIYDKIDNTYFLSLLVILLILSEFWFYWDRKIKAAEEKFAYADSKLRDLSRNLFLVKLSHDQLERFYITKPVSLRKLIWDIKTEILTKNDLNIENLIEKSFKLITMNFGVQSGAILKVLKDGELKVIYSLGDLSSIDRDDPLLKFSLERGQISYISSLSNTQQTKYLAVIPISQEGNIKYLVVIEKMPFLNLNLDNLLSINLILDYLVYDIDFLEEIKPIYRKFGEFGLDFIKEVYRMYKINTKFKVDSTVVYVYINTLEETPSDIITLNIRGLDVYTKMYFKTHKFQIVAILLPFTDTYGASIFINRIKKKLVETFSQEFVEKSVKFKYFKIDHPKRILLEMYKFEGF